MSADQRHFPRITLFSEQAIVRIAPDQALTKSRVFSKNVSASGICFRTQEPLPVNDLIFLYLDEKAIDDLHLNKAHIMKYGNYFMAKVVWNREVNDQSSDNGCAFLKQVEGDEQSLELFTNLANYYIADQVLK